MLWILVAITIVVFGLFGTQFAIEAILLREGGHIQGYYRGRPITSEEYLLFRNRWVRFLGREAGQDGNLMGLLIRLREARAAGIEATDGELRKKLKEIIKPLRDREQEGAVSTRAGEAWDSTYDAAYNRLVDRLEMTKAGFELTLREEILVSKYEEAMLRAAQPGDLEARLSHEKDNARVRARFLTFRSLEFSEFAEPKENDLIKFFQDNNQPLQSALKSDDLASSGRYYQPDRVAIEYVCALFKDQRPHASPHSEVEKFYLKNRGRFRRPEEEVRQGRSPYRSLQEVYQEIERELAEDEARSSAREVMHQIARAWFDAARSTATPRDLDGKLESIARTFSARYEPPGVLFAQSELAKAGPISKARNLATQAFRVYGNGDTEEPWTAEQALTRLSEILMSDDACFMLRIVSKVPRFSPTWDELLRDSTEKDPKKRKLPGLTVERVREDWKITQGFQRAQENAEKLRQALVERALDRLTKQLNGSSLTTFHVPSSAGREETGDIHPTVGEAATRTPAGEVSRIFLGVENRPSLVWVQEVADDKKKVQLFQTPPSSLEGEPMPPSDILLEFFYEGIRHRREFQQPGEVQVECLLARRDSFARGVEPSPAEMEEFYQAHKTTFVDSSGREQPLNEVQDRVKESVRREKGQSLAQAAVDQFRRDPAIQKASDVNPAVSPSDRSSEQDRIKKLAEDLGLVYKKNLERFRPNDRLKRLSVLGPAGAVQGMEGALADLPIGRWSDPLESSECPFLLRVLDRGEASPAALAEVRDSVSRNYVEAWRTFRPEEKLAALWEQHLHDGLDHLDEFSPLLTKSRREFRTVATDFFPKGQAPGEHPDEAAFASELVHLEPGVLSPVIAGSRAAFLALVTEERALKRVQLQYGQVREQDFRADPASIREEQLREYFESHASSERYLFPARVEIEYVFGEVEAAQKKALESLPEKDVQEYFERYRSSRYSHSDFAAVKAVVYDDLSLERGLAHLGERLRNAHAEATKEGEKADLAGIAERLGLQYATASYARSETLRLSSLSASGEELLSAFDMRPGEFSPVYKTPATQFFFRKTRTIEPAARPFDEVRSDILEAVLQAEASRAASAWVASAVEQARSMPLEEATRRVPLPGNRTVPSVKDSDLFDANSPADRVPSTELRDLAVKLNRDDVLGPIKSGGALYFAKILSEKVENQQKVLYAAFGIDAFRTSLAGTTEEDVHAHYETEKESLRRPESVRIEFLFASVSDLAESEAIKAKATDAAIAAHYEARKNEYWKNPDPETQAQTPYLPLEQVRDYVSFDFRIDQAQKLAESLIESARLRHEADPEKADLAALARETGLQYGLSGYMPREGSADVGVVPRQLQDIARLGEIAFGLKEGEILADSRLKTLNGCALIRRQELKPSHVPPIEEVRKELEARVLAEQARRKSLEHAAKVRETIEAAWKDLADPSARSEAFSRIVQSTTYVADETFRPAVRSTDYFGRPEFNFAFMRYYRQPTPFFMPPIHGMNRPGGGIRFAREAFRLARGNISRPVPFTDGDESECFLILLSGRTVPGEAEFLKGRREVQRRLEQEKSFIARESWNDHLSRLTQPPSP